MSSVAWNLLPPALGLAASLQLVFFLIHLRTRNVGWVDLGWCGGVLAAALLFAIEGPGESGRRILVALAAGCWASRLGSHLLARLLKDEEDARYSDLRDWLGAGAAPKLLVFFEAQALLSVVLALPMLAAASDERPMTAWSDALAVSLIAIGILGETLADRQLDAFKRDPSNRGRTCRRGLWRYSRHPNYFFEWVVWCGFGALALGGPGFWLAPVAPVLMYVLLAHVTGVPPAERRSLASRGEDYRAYQRATSPFFPWFPKDEA